MHDVSTAAERVRFQKKVDGRTRLFY